MAALNGGSACVRECVCRQVSYSNQSELGTQGAVQCQLLLSAADVYCMYRPVVQASCALWQPWYTSSRILSDSVVTTTNGLFLRARVLRMCAL